jgi:hypothetical protein
VALLAVYSLQPNPSVGSVLSVVVGFQVTSKSPKCLGSLMQNQAI